MMMLCFSDIIYRFPPSDFKSPKTPPPKPPPITNQKKNELGRKITGERTEPTTRSVNRTFKERPLDRPVLSQADDRPERQVVDRTANNPTHRFFHHEQLKNMSNASSDVLKIAAYASRPRRHRRISSKTFWPAADDSSRTR